MKSIIEIIKAVFGRASMPPQVAERATSIAKMIDDVIRREGGGTYVNHPADKGGSTKWGITLATLAAWRDSPDTTSHDVRNLTKAEARSIYLGKYYREPGIDKLPVGIQPFVFDAAVNHGPSRAIKFVQEECAGEGFNPGAIDGIVGPKTIAAAREFDRHFLDCLIFRRDNFYRNLADRDPSQRVFLVGWLNRLDEFRA
jgi:lysozyme family protein